MAEQILDPYATLGVGRDAGPGELARAYRRDVGSESITRVATVIGEGSMAVRLVFDRLS